MSHFCDSRLKHVVEQGLPDESDPVLAPQVLQTQEALLELRGLEVARP